MKTYQGYKLEFYEDISGFLNFIINGLMSERRKLTANALELGLSCTDQNENSSIRMLIPLHIITHNFSEVNHTRIVYDVEWLYHT